MTEVPLATTAVDAEPELLTQPADGVPPVVGTESELAATMAALRAGSGPIAVDAERAHGFRYSQRAYLIQLRRAGSGTHLVDPVAFGPIPTDGESGGPPADLSALGAAIRGAEWVIHAANQDLSCLYEVGLVPQRLFDTELAARLLGYPRVALGTMVEELLGVRLLKEHSAADWSTRPLPLEWLSYAALDVELLLELREILHARLVETGKAGWARQEFDWLVSTAGVQPEARPDPWRRTSGIHRVRTRRGLGYVAALWYARDAIAARMDRSPGKILADVAITELAAHQSPSRSGMRQIPGFARRQARRFEADWLAAIESASQLRDSELPPMHVYSEGPPQARLWPAKDPVAAARLAAVRVALLTIADEHTIPLENLLTPEYVRRLAWRPPSPVTEDSVDATLAGYGARLWQRELTVAALTPLLVTRE